MMAAETKRLPFAAQFAAGAVAGVSEISAMYPLDVAKTRLQLQTGAGPGTYRGVVDCLRRIVAEDGGIAAPLLVEAPKRATKFAANEQYAALVKRRTGRTSLSQRESVGVGVASGATEALVVSAFEVVKVRMQDRAAAHASTLQCVASLLRDEGPLALFRGLEATVWRHAAWNGGYFGVIHGVRAAIERAHGAAPGSRTRSAADDFAAGAIGGTVGTVLNTPFDVAKTRIQGATPARPRFLGRWTLPTMAAIARDEGASALYKGFVPKVLRLGPGGGILLVVFEAVSGLMRKYV